MKYFSQLSYLVLKHFGAFEKHSPGGVLSLPLKSSNDDAILTDFRDGIPYHGDPTPYAISTKFTVISYE